ncbi:amidohydrolase-like protein [Exophiala viscosa]|uniref:amidohydrolase-like protein n=1 Tax=Exophiala viscosa TaxID=2486360 RepID=UPI00219FDACE|nr:amidohydrolase-like protein [Exophiala viscosa]
MELPIPSSTDEYVLSGARLVNTLDGHITNHASIHIKDGYITSIVEGDNHTEPGLPVIDLKGKYVLPGLIDCHVHLAAVPGRHGIAESLMLSPSTSLLHQPLLCQAMLDRGFTSVRDCAGATADLKQAIEEGVHAGPRLFIAGKALSQTGGHGDFRKRHEEMSGFCGCGSGSNSMIRIVDGVPDCLKYAREELRRGADFIKIMSGGGVISPSDRIDQVQFSDEEIKAIVTVATNARTYVTSHAYTPEAIQQAISQGVRSIEHGNLLDDETAQLMVRSGVFLTPTLSAYDTLARPKYSKLLPQYAVDKNQEVLDKGFQAIKIASDAGVTLCFGSDLLGPMHEAQTLEFVLRSRVQKPLPILQSATVNAARLIQQEKSLGHIAVGFLADMLILNSNPLEDITILAEPDHHLLATIQGGRVVSSRWSRLQVKQHRLTQIE